jgi:renin receptor
MNTFNSIIVLILINTCYATKYLEVIFAPKSIEFSDETQHQIKSSEISDFISLVLGNTLSNRFQWSAIRQITNVFDLPTISVTFITNQNQFNFQNSHKFPIIEESLDDINEQFNIISKRTAKRYSSSDEKPYLIKLDLPQYDLNDDLMNELNINRDTNDDNNQFNSLFAREISTIKHLLNSLSNLNKPINGIFIFSLNGLEQLRVNSNNETISKANQITQNMIEQAIRTFRSLNNDKVIVTVIEDDGIVLPHVRRTRDAKDLPSGNNINNATKLNLAHNYDPNFHVAFVLISFTTILIAIIIFGLSIAMWNMDPGRDSIIYRMTAQRIKKEQ